MQMKLLFIALILLLSSHLPLREKADLPFKDGERVLFVGDSITQDGRYIALTEAFLWAAHPNLKLDIVNGGLSSETVSGITEPGHPFPRPNVNERLGRALRLVRPDWVVVCYGMNDGIYQPADQRILNAYRNGLTEVIKSVQQSGAKLILMTPPSFDVEAAPIQAKLKEASKDTELGYQKPYPQYDQTLVKLSEIVQSFDSHESVDRVIDLHSATSSYLKRVKNSNPDYQYGDGVHPPIDGHLAIARAVLAGLGCDAANANAVINRLTGIAAPVGEAKPVSESQLKFQSTLFSRFSKRSAAYRKAIGFVAPFKFDADDVPVANRQAYRAEQELRDMMVSLTDGESIVAPLKDKAIEKWEKDIAKLAALDQTETYSDDAILFIGSSSIRLWENIAQDMAPYEPIRRGYGGARFSDLVVFAERLITPHQFQAMVVFVGNDVTGKVDDPSATEVQRMARYVCEVSQKQQPDAPVLLMEITPTPSRFKNWSEIREVNSKLRELALQMPGVHFVSTAEQYLNDDRQPIDEYFRTDRLHQNEAGYAVWSKLIKAKLDRVLKR